MKICKKCKNKKICKKICFEVEQILKRLNHSLKSNYFIKTVDPFLLCKMYIQKSGSVYNRQRKVLFLIKKLKFNLMSMKRTYKETVILYYGLNGESPITQQQIAKKLNLSQNTIKYRLMKSRELLKEVLLGYI